MVEETSLLVPVQRPLDAIDSSGQPVVGMPRQLSAQHQLPLDAATPHTAPHLSARRQLEGIQVHRTVHDTVLLLVGRGSTISSCLLSAEALAVPVLRV